MATDSDKKVILVFQSVAPYGIDEIEYTYPIEFFDDDSIVKNCIEDTKHNFEEQGPLKVPIPIQIKQPDCMGLFKFCLDKSIMINFEPLNKKWKYTIKHYSIPKNLGVSYYENDLKNIKVLFDFLNMEMPRVIICDDGTYEDEPYYYSTYDDYLWFKNKQDYAYYNQ